MMRKNAVIVFLSVVLVISVGINCYVVPKYTSLNNVMSEVSNYESIVSVVSLPDRFDGKRTMVEGVLSIDEDGAALYLSKEHKEHNAKKFAIYLDVPEYAHEGLSAWDGCYLDVRGSLDMDNYGPNESYCGTMKNVELIKQESDVLFGEK